MKQDIKTMTKAELDALNLQRLGEELSDRITTAIFGKPATKRAAKKKPKISSVIAPPKPLNAVPEPPREPVLTWNAAQCLFSEDFGVSRKPRKTKRPPW